MKNSRNWLLAIAVTFALQHEAAQGYRHVRLETSNHSAASSHPNGAAAMAWLSEDANIITDLALPPEGWSSKLVMGYAGSYNAEILKPLIYSVLAHTDQTSMLVLFCPKGDNLGLSEAINATGRVIVQEHAMPEGFGSEDLPYPVSLRFFVAKSFLAQIQHTGTTFFVDTRDVFVQTDPFAAFDDGLLHFPRESGAYRINGPFTWNPEWMANCYGNDTLKAIGGNYVLNSGTFIGPSEYMRLHFELIIQEVEAHWQCRRAHGSDQAMHNFLVYTGRVAEAGLPYRIEDQVQGLFAFMAYTHPALWEFRWNEHGKEEMCNRGEGKPYVAIHMWPGDNRVDKVIVRPFVKAYDKMLHASAVPESVKL